MSYPRSEQVNVFETYSLPLAQSFPNEGDEMPSVKQCFMHAIGARPYKPCWAGGNWVYRRSVCLTAGRDDIWKSTSYPNSKARSWTCCRASSVYHPSLQLLSLRRVLVLFNRCTNEHSKTSTFKSLRRHTHSCCITLQQYIRLVSISCIYPTLDVTVVQLRPCESQCSELWCCIA
jgi:hypothetical protein